MNFQGEKCFYSCESVQFCYISKGWSQKCYMLLYYLLSSWVCMKHSIPSTFYIPYICWEKVVTLRWLRRSTQKGISPLLSALADFECEAVIPLKENGKAWKSWLPWNCGAFRRSTADTRVSRYLRNDAMQDLAWQAWQMSEFQCNSYSQIILACILTLW